ncbi:MULTISPECIES: hypothetical protein [Bacillaceae]|jgi:hypothetical protein|nr:MULTISPECIES: hypothetical protein [Bacillus]MCU4961691.1 hypothetical protein [Bacillus paranthracis]MDX5925993.1 hypothetical protein [Bacillus cereus group sp. BfR-BA-00967]
MNMEDTQEYKYQTLIDILAEMVKGYLTNQPTQKEGEKKDESTN